MTLPVTLRKMDSRAPHLRTMHRVPQRRSRRLLVVVGSVVLALLAMGASTHAQDRSQLIRVLDGNADFRVRVQAAFALGNTGDAAVVPHLERALRDDNPAVRAAAATALGRIGSPLAVPALRRAQRDSSAAVRLQVAASLRAIESGGQREQAMPERRERARPTYFPPITVIPTEDSIAWPRVRYVVFLGDMQNRSRFGGDRMASLLRSEVERNLARVRHVAVLANPNRIDRRAEREIRRRRLPKIRVDGSVTSIQRRVARRELSVRCEVSLMLLDHPELALRGELRGAASGSEPRRAGRQRRAQEERLAAQALEVAVRSAMSNVRDALARAAGR